MPPINVNIDFAGLASILVNAIIDGMKALVAPLPQAFEQWMLSAIQSIISTEDGANVLTQVPRQWTSQDSDVISLYYAGVVAELGVFLVVLCIQGFRVMSGRIDMWEAILRTVFFAMVGAGMLTLSDLLINVANGLASDIGATQINLAGQSLPSSLELGIVLIIAMIFALFAWIKGAVGVLFIKVLIVAAPYMLTASALPILDGLGKWWAEEFTTWLLRPFMVALVLRLGLGLAAREGGPLGLLFTLVSFWLAYTMDTRIRRLSVGSWGTVGQLGLFARGARMAAGALGGGAAGAAVAAAPAGAAATAGATP